RDVLQYIGTDLFRDKFHDNVWVNALFSDYVCSRCKTYPHNYENKKHIKEDDYPNWIITDMRFPNELKAVKDRGGITIRVNRIPTAIINEVKYFVGTDGLPEHPSETVLDNAEFDYVVDNN